MPLPKAADNTAPLRAVGAPAELPEKITAGPQGPQPPATAGGAP